MAPNGPAARTTNGETPPANAAHPAQGVGGTDRAALAARLRHAGQRVTPQRLAILGALAPGEHLSADDVYARVEAAVPAVNRSTVYRTLELFRDLRLVTETDLGGGVRQFEPFSDPHHHLICHGCGRILDVDDALVRPLRDAIRARHGFAAGIDHLALFGRCAACRSTPATASDPPASPS